MANNSSSNIQGDFSVTSSASSTTTAPDSSTPEASSANSATATSTPAHDHPAIAFVGLGPRGISALERLIAYLRGVEEGGHPHPEALELHLIDDAQHGGGRIWDISQPRELCMNTFAHGMTLFAEPGATVAAPVVEGPTIYEWVRLLLAGPEANGAAGDGAAGEIAQPKLDYVTAHPLDYSVVDDFGRDYLESIRPESYPLRALYGHYLLWFYRSILADAPSWVTVTEHSARAVDLHATRSDGEPSASASADSTGEAASANADTSADTDTIVLDNGTTLVVDASIVTPGWSTQALNDQERWITKTLEAHPQLKWIRADSPIDQGIDKIEDNEKVLVRGLGMGFFDVAIMCTQARGGRFVDDDSKPWGVRYEATGKEPTFYASSRRGYPFMPQSNEHGLPAPAAIPRLKEVIVKLAKRKGENSIDYDAEVWPAVLRDAYQAYLDTLARVEPRAIRTSLSLAVDALDAAEIDAGAVFNGIAAVDKVIADHTTTRFSLLRWIHLLPAHFDSPAELDAYLTERVLEDLHDSELGPDSPVRAALWSIGFSRKPTQVLGAEGRYTLESRHHMFDKAVNLGQLACSGPPIFRTRQLLALVDAGVVHFVGAYPLLGTDRDTGEWTMSSPSSGGYRFHGTTLLDAWVHKPALHRAPEGSLTRALAQSGRLVPFNHHAVDGAVTPTGSPALDPQTRQAVTGDRVSAQSAAGDRASAQSAADRRLHVVGIPAHAQYPDTTISPPIPGTDSWFIQETDKAAVSAARQVLG